MRRAGVLRERETRRPMDGDLPPLMCFSYMCPNALRRSLQPLTGGGIACAQTA